METGWVKVENGFDDDGEDIVNLLDNSIIKSNKKDDGSAVPLFIPPSTDSSNGIITKDEIKTFRNNFEQDLSAKVAQNACRDASVHRISMDRDILLKSNDFTFNTLIDDLDDMDVTNQQSR